MLKCKNEFLNLFEDILEHKFDAKTFEVFDPTIDSIHRNLRPKISLVGFSGVGKTTITKLIKADEIPMQHIPTITGDIATIRIGKLHFHLWDFAGQEQFSYLWNNFIKGSDAVLLITDSTLENVEKSKYFLELIKEQAPNAQSAVIGNKQDLDNAIDPVQIEKVLGLKTYSMIALHPENRDKMIQIIADVLEMSAEVSPLLKPLLERDKLTEEAVAAVKDNNFEKAAFLFDKISDLCIDLGDDSLGREFFEKSQKIKEMLKKVGAPPPTPASPTPKEEAEKIAVKKVKEKPETPEVSSQEIAKTEEKDKGVMVENASVQLKADASEEAPEIVEKIAKEEILPKESVPAKGKISLNLNPEDFMVKARPKSVKIVPKDAKSKLKTSSHGHVKPTDKPKVITPVSPIKLMTEKQKVTPPPPKTPEISKKTPKSVKIKTSTTIEQKGSTKVMEKKPDITVKKDEKKQVATTITEEKVEEKPEVESKQEESLKKSLLDLKIKKANLTKMALDFDMKELTGEISSEELKEKKSKIEQLIQQVDNQIQELQKLLSN